MVGGNGIQKVKDFFTEKVADVPEVVSEYFNNVSGTDKFDTKKYKIGNKHYQDFIEAMDSDKLKDMSNDEVFAAYQKNLKKAGETTTGFQKLISMAGTALKSFGATMLTVSLSIAASWLVSKGIQLLDKVANRDKYTIEDGEKAAEKIKEVSDSYKASITSLNDMGKKYSGSDKALSTTGEAVESLAEKYVELSDGVDKFSNENVALSNDDYQNFLDISNQLAELFPSLVSGYDSNGNAILNLGSNAETAAEQLNTLLEAERNAAHFEIAENIQSEYEGIVEKSKQSQKKIDNYNKKIQDLKLESDSLSNGLPVNDYTVTFDKNNKKQYEEVKKIYQRYGLYDESRNPIAGIGSKALDGEYVIRVSPKINNLDQESKKKLQTELNSVYSAEINENLQKKQSEELKNENYWKSLVPDIQSYLQTESTFSSLNSTLQDAIIGQLGDLNISSITDDYAGDVEDFLYGEIIGPISNLESKAQEKLANLFTLDNDSMSFEKYKKKVEKILDDIYGNEDSAEKSRWKDILGFGDMEDEYLKQLSAVNKAVTETTRDAKKSLTSLTGEDLKIAYDLVLNDHFSGTYNELIDAIERKKQELISAGSVDIEEIIKDPDSNYQKITKALEDPNRGATYDQYYEWKKQAKELVKTGDIGTDDFKTIASSFSPTGADDYANWVENLGKIDRYFTEDTSGIKNFMKDLEKLGQADFDESTGEFISHYTMGFQELADAMNIGYEPMMAMFGKLEDKGYANDFFATTEEGFQTINNLQKDLYQAQLELNHLETTDSGNTTAIEAKKKEIQEYTDRINAAKESLDTLLKEGTPKTPEEVAEENKKNKKALDRYRNDYNNNLKGKYRDTEEGKKYLEDYRNNFISAANQAGYENAGVNDRGNLVLDVEKSNKKIQKENKALISSYEELEKKSKEAYGTEDASKYSEKADKAYKKIQKAAEDAGLSVEDFLEKYGDGFDDSEKVIKIDTQLDASGLEEQENKLTEGQTIQFTANVDDAETTVNAIKQQDGTIEYTAQVEDGSVIKLQKVVEDGAISFIKVDNEEANNNISETEGELSTIDGTIAEAILKVIDKGSSVVNSFRKKLDTLDGKKATTTIETVKKTTYKVDKPKGNSGKDKTTTPFNGTFHAQGTTGMKKVSIRKNEDAVINEVGKEGVVRDGKLLTFNNGYPTKVKLKRGDIVFNHKQMEDLEKKGYVTNSHAKIVGGDSAFAKGTVVSNAYANQGNTVGQNPLLGTNSGKKTTTTKGKSSSSGDKDGKKTSKKWDDFIKKLGNLFDWIEVRLDVLSKKTERWTKLAENAVNYSAKRANYQKAVNATIDEMNANQTAESKYLSKAKSIGKRAAGKSKSDNITQKWVDGIMTKLVNGTLDITKYSDKKLDVVEKMKEWYDKSQDASERFSELTESLADLYTELENLANNEAAEKVEEIDHQLSLLSTNYDMANSLDARQANLQAQNQKAKETMDAYNKAYSSTSSSLSQAMTSLSKLGISANGVTGIDANDSMSVAQLKAVAKYNAALEANKEALKNAQQAQTDYNKTLYDNAHQMFQNIIDEFEFKRELIAQRSTRINNAMELNETKGYRNSKVYYEGIMANDQEEYAKMKQQLAEAEAKLEENLRTIKDYKGTVNYQEEVRGINEIINAMDEMDIKMAQTQNDMNQLDWDNFDKLQEAISRVTDEASFLIDELSRKDLVDSDTGTFTDEGRAVMALYAGNYEASRQQVEMYNKEIADWKKYMKDNDLEDNDEARNHLNDLVDAQREYASACQESKYAMIDMAKDGLNAQKDYLQEVIDKYKDLMDKQQDAYEYQKNLNNAVEEINNVQKQIEVYSGDNSEENRARIQQLNKDLKDKQESLQDMQREKLTSDINNMFDDLMDNYGDYIDDLMSEMDDNFDDLISAVNEGLGDTQTVIEEFADSLGIDLSEQLRAIQHGNNIEQSTKDSINQIESDQNKLVNDADSRATDDISNIDSEANALDTARDNAVAKGEADRAEQARQQAQQQASQSAEAQRLAEEQARLAADEKAEKDRADFLTAIDFIGSHFYKPKSGTKASDIKNATKKKIFEKTKDRTVTVENLNALAGLLGVSSSGLYNRLNELGVFKAIGKSGIIQFAKGSKNIPNDMIAQIGEKGHEIVYRSADGSILTPLGKNDMVFTHEMSENLWQMAKQRNITTVPGVERVDRTAGTVNNMCSGDIIIQLNGNIELPNVYDAKEFTEQLKQIIKSDRNVQGLLMDSTVNKALTSNYNSLSVNKW